MIEIKVNCSGSHEFALDEMHVFQNVNEIKLKELSNENFDKLRRRLETNGFWFPFFHWKNPKDGKIYFIDGTQRDTVLNWMRERPSEYKLPEKFPSCEIFAKNEKEAAEAILTQSTAYGQMTEEGLYGVLKHYNLIPQFENFSVDLNIPQIDLRQFKDDWIGKPEFSEPMIKEYDENIECNSKCPKCGYEWQETK